jgi:hypothetical protein
MLPCEGMLLIKLLKRKGKWYSAASFLKINGFVVKTATHIVVFLFLPQKEKMLVTRVIMIKRSIKSWQLKER